MIGLWKQFIWRHSECKFERGFWLVSERKTWRHSEFTSERGFWINTEKDWIHSETTTRRDLWLVSGKNVVKTFCDYIWARFLSKYWQRFKTYWGYNYAKFMIG